MSARILVVDDEADVRLMLRHALAGADRELLFAQDASSGLAMAREQRPDVVVLDYQLPDGRGTDIARSLLAERFTGHLVVFSAHATERLASEVEALGLPFCAKVDLQGLQAEVDRALAGSGTPDDGVRPASGPPRPPRRPARRV